MTATNGKEHFVKIDVRIAFEIEVDLRLSISTCFYQAFESCL